MADTDIKTTPSPTKPRKTLILDPGGKGGVGKSMAITALADWLDVSGRKIKIYDAESKTSRTKRVFEEEATHYKITDEGQQSVFLESLQADADVVLHDTGGGYELNEYLSKTIGGGPGSLPRLFGIIDEMGWDVTLFHILNASPETAVNIGDWLDVLEEQDIQSVRHVVCLNQKYAPTEDSCEFWMGTTNYKTGKPEGGNTRQQVLELVEKGKAAMILLPNLPTMVSSKIEISGMRFSEAMVDERVPIGERIQVKSFFDAAGASFGYAAQFLGLPEVEAKDAA